MGSEKRGKREINGFRVFATLVIGMVAVVVVVGLYLAGSPNKERQRRFDQQRLNDLQTISSAIDVFFDANRRVPETLAELTNPSIKLQYYISSLNDPETGVPYGYVAKGGADYDLCAVFALTSAEDQNSNYYPKSMSAPMPMYPGGPVASSWDHLAGNHCFSLNAEMHVVREACSLTNPCQAGQSCVSLPDRKGSFCVPTGKECLAAGCAEANCTIAESYPAQVRCTTQPATPPTSSCQLMKEKKTGRVDCFGCGTRVCKDPAPGWETYAPPKDSVGIPYACFDDNGSCALAQ